MPEMKSLGKMPEKSLGDCCVPMEAPKEPYFPSTYVDSKQMPEIDEWEVGEEYTITVVVKMRSYSLSERADESRSSAELELLKYATKAPKSLS